MAIKSQATNKAALAHQNTPPKYRSQILTYAVAGPDSHGLEHWIDGANAKVRDDLRDLVPKLAVTARKVTAAAKRGGLSSSNIPPQALAAFASDFYHCYTTGSGVLSNHLGAELVLATFRALSPHFGTFADFEDALLWDELPEEFGVYRGGSGPAEHLARGLSWTRSHFLASSFAFGADPMVLMTKVSRRHLLGCFVFQEECILDVASFPELVVEETTPVFA